MHNVIVLLCIKVITPTLLVQSAENNAARDVQETLDTMLQNKVLVVLQTQEL